MTAWDEVGDPPLHYDRLGVAISLREWSHLLEDKTYSRIATTHVGPWLISTVWIGINYAFFGGPPLIFETMVFNDDQESSSEWETRRYPTEGDARIGHDEVVHLVETLEQVEAKEWQPGE